MEVAGPENVASLGLSNKKSKTTLFFYLCC